MVFKPKKRFVQHLVTQEGLPRARALRRWQRLKSSSSTTTFLNRKGQLCLPIEIDKTITAEEFVESNIAKRKLTKQVSDADENEMEKCVALQDIVEPSSSSLTGAKAITTTSVVESDAEDDSKPFRIDDPDVDIESSLPKEELNCML